MKKARAGWQSMMPRRAVAGAALLVAMLLARSPATASVVTADPDGTTVRVTVPTGKVGEFVFSIVNQWPQGDPPPGAAPGPWLGLLDRPNLGESRLIVGPGCWAAPGNSVGGFYFDALCRRAELSKLLVTAGEASYISTLFDWPSDALDDDLADFATTIQAGQSGNYLGDLPGPTAFHGGQGRDTVSYMRLNLNPFNGNPTGWMQGPPVNVTLDGVANDGYPGERTDAVGPGINDVRGTLNDDTLVGHGGNNELDGWAGTDRILGGDGHDQLRGDGGSLYGGAGKDWIELNHRGSPRRYGHVYCGPGDDRVFFWSGDQYEPDCEGGANLSTGESWGQPNFSWPSEKGEFDLDHGMRIPLECLDLASGSCEGVVNVATPLGGAEPAAAPSTRRRRFIRIGSGRFRIRAGARKRVRVPFTRRGRRIARRKMRVVVRVRLREEVGWSELYQRTLILRRR